MAALSLILGAALAAEPRLIAVVEAKGVREAYREYARQRGALGLETELVCRDLGAGFEACLFEEGAHAGYITMARLAATDPLATASWGQVVAEARTALPAALEVRPVDPADPTLGTYWRAAGAAAAQVFLVPDQLPRCAEGPLLVAAPTRGETLLWCGGASDRDAILAVGVARAYDAADHQVQPHFVHHAAQGWSVFGVVELKGPSREPTP